MPKSIVHSYVCIIYVRSLFQWWNVLTEARLKVSQIYNNVFCSQYFNAIQRRRNWGGGGPVATIIFPNSYKRSSLLI